MKTVETISDIKKISRSCVLTIGNFDGVHLGHQQILTAAVRIASQRKTQLVAMIFDPHPLAILNPQKAPGILTPLQFKKHLLAELKVDCLFIQKSTPDLLALPPAAYVERFIVEAIQPGIVVEGESFNFGSGRAGNVQLLQKLGAENGFEVSVIDCRSVKLSTGQPVKVSSTVIRNLLSVGSVADAAVALGRPYRLLGRVVRGHGKGKRLGFPTLNLQPLNQLVPAEGVYAGRVEIGDSVEYVCSANEKIPAVFSIGRAQTLADNYPLLIEAHILTGGIGDLYGKWLAMDFIKRIRSQQKFGSEKELSLQVAKDCKKAKNILDIKDVN